MDAGELYKRMHLIRQCEERIRQEYSKDEIKTPTHLGVGSEAIAVGLAHVYSEAKYFSTYRNHAIYLALGGSLDEFWGELYGKETGCAKGKAGSMHLSAPEKGLLLTSAVVGTTIPIAVGASLAFQYERTKTISCVLFGDGATEEGVFHESLNFASLNRLPILFVCEDNNLAIHNQKETREKYNIQRLVEAYGIVYRSGDAYTLDEVIKLAEYVKPLVKDRPCFLHLKYHRFYEHVGPNEDYTQGYRTQPVNLSKLDPVKTLEAQRCVKMLSDESRREIRTTLQAAISDAVEKSKQASFPAISELLTDVFEVRDAI